jgi:multidrug efflux pump subunit AcrA (membrane-fusion protein)
MQKPKIRFKLFTTVLSILVVALILAGCQSKSLTGKKEMQEVIPVRVMRVELKDIYKTLEYVGNIKAEEEAVVYPRVSGKIIEKVKEDGSKVKKGDTLFYIDRDEVGLKFEKAPIESPLDGVVGRIYVDIGANVVSQTPVALIVYMDRVKIGLSIPEKYIPQVSLGQNAAIIVDAYAEKFKGVVTKISPVLDTDTRSAPAEITVDNKGHLLKSGMFARVSLIIDESKAVPIVLKESIMGKAPDAYVYVIENNKAILRNVKLGIRQDGYFEVIDGIKEGDAVVVMGQQRLKDGIDVKMEY